MVRADVAKATDDIDILAFDRSCFNRSLARIEAVCHASESYLSELS
jgi:hypothetical protein